MRLTITVSFLLATVIAVASSGAEDEEHRIDRSALPPAVERAVAEASAGAEVRGLSTETEDGRTSYEAELLVNGRSKDVSIDSSGAIVEIEEEVRLDSLPAAVREALVTHAGRAKIVRVESITKNGSVVAYEAQIKKALKRSEIEVDLQGRLIEEGG